MRYSNDEIKRQADNSLRRSRDRRQPELQRKSNTLVFCVVSALVIAAAIVGTLALAGTYSGIIAAALIVVAAFLGVGAQDT